MVVRGKYIEKGGRWEEGKINDNERRIGEGEDR